MFLTCPPGIVNKQASTVLSPFSTFQFGFAILCARLHLDRAVGGAEGVVSGSDECRLTEAISRDDQMLRSGNCSHGGAGSTRWRSGRGFITGTDQGRPESHAVGRNASSGLAIVATLRRDALAAKQRRKVTAR